MDIATTQADQFRSAKPRLYRKGEQCRVAPPGGARKTTSPLRSFFDAVPGGGAETVAAVI